MHDVLCNVRLPTNNILPTFPECSLWNWFKLFWLRCNDGMKHNREALFIGSPQKVAETHWQHIRERRQLTWKGPGKGNTFFVENYIPGITVVFILQICTHFVTFLKNNTILCNITYEACSRGNNVHLSICSAYMSDAFCRSSSADDRSSHPISVALSSFRVIGVTGDFVREVGYSLHWSPSSCSRWSIKMLIMDIRTSWTMEGLLRKAQKCQTSWGKKPTQTSLF